MPGVLTDDASQIMLLLRGVVVSWLCVCDMYSSSRHPVVIIMTRKREQEIRLQDCGLGGWSGKGREGEEKSVRWVLVRPTKKVGRVS